MYLILIVTEVNENFTICAYIVTEVNFYSQVVKVLIVTEVNCYSKVVKVRLNQSYMKRKKIQAGSRTRNLRI